LKSLLRAVVVLEALEVLGAAKRITN
jgi:hypothetical protein